MRLVLVSTFLAVIAAPSFATTGNHAPEVSRAEIAQAMDDLNYVLTESREVPHFENGQPDGYKKVQLKPGGIYDRLSLESGEVITAPDPNQTSTADSAQVAEQHVE